jgi:integrase
LREHDVERLGAVDVLPKLNPAGLALACLDGLRGIAKACKAAAIPLWSPHDLRHRRISLLHLRGVPWARIGEFVGQRDLTVTANTYTHVIADEAELDYAALLRS